MDHHFRSQILEGKKPLTKTHLSQAVKAVPPCNLVSQLFSIGMAWNKDDFMPAAGLNHRVHTEWQWPLSGAHSIGKFRPAWWRWGMHAHPLSLYLPSGTKLYCALQLRGQIHSTYFCYTLICTLWVKQAWVLGTLKLQNLFYIKPGIWE